MSKIDTKIINNIKMLSLDMISEAGSGYPKYAINTANIFYSLFSEHLMYNTKNTKWINRDRLIVNNKLLPVMYATLHTFGFDISLDNLKDFKKLNSVAFGYGNTQTSGIESSNIVDGDIVGISAGIALGERYLGSIIKNVNSKSNLINFHTICVCLGSDILSGTSLESLEYIRKEKLNNIIYIIFNEYKDDRIYKILKSMDYDLFEVDSKKYNAIADTLEDAYESNKPCAIIVDYINEENINYVDNTPLSIDDISKLRAKYNITNPFTIDTKDKEEIITRVQKRLSKDLAKWEQTRNESLNNDTLKSIIGFLETKNLGIELNVDNLKINDDYEENLETGNTKIFNILASKSPFILSLSNIDNTDKFIFMDNVLSMSSIASGLAHLGFKVFVKTNLSNSALIKPFIKYSALNKLNVNYIFTKDTFINTYDDTGYGCIDELSSLRLIPNHYTFRPADILEIIGTYSIIASNNLSSSIVIGNAVTPKLTGTNPKYVVAGMYRVKREVGEANGILLASGEELQIALKVSEELLQYGIDLRVVSAPCIELFKNQNDRYQAMLLPKELKIFAIEFSDGSSYLEFTNKDRIFSINKYSTSGTKEELLNNYNLDIDSIKSKIIECYKS